MREWFSISIMGYSMQGIILDMPPSTRISYQPDGMKLARGKRKRHPMIHQSSRHGYQVSKSKMIHRSSRHGGQEARLYIGHLRKEVSNGKMIHTSIIRARVSKSKAVTLALVCVSRRRDSNHLGTSVSRRQDISHAAYQEGKGPKQN